MSMNGGADAAAAAARTRAFAMTVGEWRKAAVAAGFTLQRIVVVEGVDDAAPKPTLCIRPPAAAGEAPGGAADVTPAHKRPRGTGWGAGGAGLTTPTTAAAERERHAAAAAAAYLPSSEDDGAGGGDPAELGLTTPPAGGSASGAGGTPATPASGDGADGSGAPSGGSSKRKGRGSRSTVPKRSHWSDEDHNKLEAGLRKYGWGKFGVIRTEFGLTSRLAASIERYAYRVKKQQPESSLAATWHDSHGKRMRNMENDGAPTFGYLPEGFKPLGAGKRKEATATYIAAAEKAGTLIPSQIIPVEGIMPPPLVPVSATLGAPGGAAGATTGAVTSAGAANGVAPAAAAAPGGAVVSPAVAGAPANGAVPAPAPAAAPAGSAPMAAGVAAGSFAAGLQGTPAPSVGPGAPSGVSPMGPAPGAVSVSGLPPTVGGVPAYEPPAVSGASLS